MKKVLTVAAVIFAMLLPIEGVAGPNEDLHMACKSAIKQNLQGRAILRGIDYNPSNAIAKYRVRGSTGAQYVTCIQDKSSGRITLIDRETESPLEMLAGL
tara:strand:- start:261 stop:560 length:300 start_codon:yes stop_codon:yes gene_type:complete